LPSATEEILETLRDPQVRFISIILYRDQVIYY